MDIRPQQHNVHFVTSSNDTAAFLNAYPDITTVTNGTDSYTMNMVYYDPQGNRYNSSSIEQTISPGATLSHNYTLTAESNGSYTLTVEPAAITTHTITFTQTALSEGGTWTVTFGGTTKSSTGTPITFEFSDGSYQFTVTASTGQQPTPASGTITISGNNVAQAVSFNTNQSNQGGLPFDTTTIIIIAVVAVSAIAAVALLAKRRSSNKAKKRGTVETWPPPPPPPQNT